MSGSPQAQHTPHTPHTPHTMAARRALVSQILASRDVSSQEELGQLLADEGFHVTQATLSRDLDAIGAVKVVGAEGRHAYSVSGASAVDTSIPTAGAEAAVVRLAADLLIRAEAAGNIAVLHTPPGAAQFYAGHIDRSSNLGVVGSVAGDDTIILVMRTNRQAQDLCDRLLRAAEQRSSQ